MATNWSDPESVREYMKAYYRAHSTRTPMISGTERQEKKCRRCGEVKCRAEFTVRQSGPRKGHLASYCKPCCAAAVRGIGEREPERYRRVEWPSKLKRLYGITVADYEAMLYAQGGRCALCGSKSPRSRSYKRNADARFCVDHCHATGRVRGLLCTGCNRAIGLIRDNADVARKMAEYLSK